MMPSCFCFSEDGVPIVFLTPAAFADWSSKQDIFVQNWVNTQGFTAKPETYCQIPDQTGHVQAVLVGHKYPTDFFFMGYLAAHLPAGQYTLQHFTVLGAIAFGMGAYQFKKYKSSVHAQQDSRLAQLFLPKDHQNQILPLIKAIYFTRDLINIPAEDMNPDALSRTANILAEEFSAEFREIVDQELITQNFPTIYTVGRAASHRPRLIDFSWGDPNAPKITLIGKGVCFDTGGLDLKNASGMLTMKKDMGGAAHVLGLAYLIMQFNLPVRLRVLIPAVENAISGNAYRPGDVIVSRQGLSIEIGNTDAEGRLVLCDALSLAVSEHPDLMIDFATLTGSARIALGSELPALFTNDDQLAQDLQSLGEQLKDPVWRMPLYQPYRKLLDSRIADINNVSSSSYGGAITAALFLKEFVPDNISWAHFDIMAYNTVSSAGHPEGGEAMGIRTVFAYLQKRFCARSSAE